jgi:hypothetical protein
VPKDARCSKLKVQRRRIPQPISSSGIKVNSAFPYEDLSDKIPKI